MKRNAGLTLVELMLVIAVLGIIASIAFASYQGYKDRANIATATSDIISLSMVILAYQTDNYALPNSLSDVGAQNKLDPWGNPYQYLNIQTAKGKGKLRKDKSLNPINSDFDLYSMGKDGLTSTPLTAKNSQDDVIRASDGKFIGLASDF